MIGIVAAGTLVAAIGTTPAVARNVPRARHGGQVAFTRPSQASKAKSVCQPTVKKPCPQTNNVWSGYVVTPGSTSHPFISVSATWVQTRVTCVKSNAWVLFWVGLDGYKGFSFNPTVEQGGTSAQCVGGGTPDYEAWWEMYPTNAVQTVFPINVGDHMSSSVVFSSVDDSYTVSVTDNTTGDSFVVVCSVPDNSYTMTMDGVTTGPTSFAIQNNAPTLCAVSAPCVNGSAEWVVEAPGGNGSPGTPYPLARYKTISFKSVHAANNIGDEGSITDTAWNAVALDLTSNVGVNEANVQMLKKQGTTFRDVWVRSQ